MFEPPYSEYFVNSVMSICGPPTSVSTIFEYTMLKGINDSDEDARALVKLMRKYKLPAKINLIPFNPWTGVEYECSDMDQIQRFSDIVYEGGISAPIRTPRGRDIMAACGQLKSASEKKSKAELLREAAGSTGLVA